MNAQQRVSHTTPAMADILALSHVFNGISSGCAVAIGFVFTAWYHRLEINLLPFFEAILSTMLISSGGFIVNDILDIAIDRVNRPDRPLAAGRISMSLAWTLYLLYNAAGILLAVSINVATGFVGLLIAVGLFLYSYSLKRKFLVGHLTIAAMGAALMPFGGLAAGYIIPAVYTIPAVFAAFFAREILKTVPDVEGDRANAVVNVATRYGPQVATRLAQAILALTAVLLPVVQFLWTSLNPWFTAIVVLLIWPLSLFVLLRTGQNVKITLRLSKLLFLLVAAAFLIGSL